jgi:hypothetical protein
MNVTLQFIFELLQCFDIDIAQSESWLLAVKCLCRGAPRWDARQRELAKRDPLREKDPIPLAAPVIMTTFSLNSPAIAKEDRVLGGVQKGWF